MNKAEKEIIRHFQEESFTRNKITDISHLDSYMTLHDFEINSISKYGDKIRNGTYRRFFTREKGVSKIKIGQVYHNINNMWWIVIGKRKYTNIPCFDILEEILLTTKLLLRFHSLSPDKEQNKGNNGN